MLKPNAQLT